MVADQFNPSRALLIIRFIDLSLTRNNECYVLMFWLCALHRSDCRWGGNQVKKGGSQTMFLFLSAIRGAVLMVFPLPFRALRKRDSRMTREKRGFHTRKKLFCLWLRPPTLPYEEQYGQTKFRHSTGVTGGGQGYYPTGTRSATWQPGSIFLSYGFTNIGDDGSS